MSFLDNVPLKDMVQNRDYLIILPEKGAYPGWDVTGIVVARFLYQDKERNAICNLINIIGIGPREELDTENTYVFGVMKVYSGGAEVSNMLTVKDSAQRFDIDDRSGFMVVETLEQYPKWSTSPTLPTLTVLVAAVLSTIITTSPSQL
jgi:hypothetical protein